MGLGKKSLPVKSFHHLTDFLLEDLFLLTKIQYEFKTTP
jgi:hypothetical protein